VGFVRIRGIVKGGPSTWVMPWGVVTLFVLMCKWGEEEKWLIIDARGPLAEFCREELGVGDDVDVQGRLDLKSSSQIVHLRVRKVWNLSRICSECGGRMVVRSRTSRARKGGTISHLKSLEPGQMSMTERGKLGGRPRAMGK